MPMRAMADGSGAVTAPLMATYSGCSFNGNMPSKVPRPQQTAIMPMAVPILQSLPPPRLPSAMAADLSDFSPCRLTSASSPRGAERGLRKRQGPPRRGRPLHESESGACRLRPLLLPRLPGVAICGKVSYRRTCVPSALSHDRDVPNPNRAGVLLAQTPCPTYYGYRDFHSVAHRGPLIGPNQKLERCRKILQIRLSGAVI